MEHLSAQKRELEIQLRIIDAEREHAYTVLNSIADAVLVTDPFNELALANEAAARILGFELEPSLHQPVDQVVHDTTLGKLIKDTREGGDTALRRHVEHHLPMEGRQAVFDVTLKCVAGGSQRRSNEPCGVVTILRDVTHEREVAEMKSDFVSSVSHELRTPLSSIKAYLEMLIDGEAHDEATRLEFYNIIQAEATRLSRLIDNILNLSRIESGVVRVQREQVNLPALIKEAVDVIAPQARAKQVRLEEVPTPLFSRFMPTGT
ncbi:MAG: PAS domain-containing protein [Phycisphaerales bacterium]|nr:PAS domain-containing protein [Phycisphaerales bacterium]